MLKYINSKDNKKIKEVSLLKDKSNREDSGLFLVEGRHILDMAISTDALVEVFTETPLDIDPKYPQYIVKADILKKLSSQVSPQGVVAVCKTNKDANLTSKAIIALDDIQDPGNVGTILRSALAFGFRDILVSKLTASTYSSKVIQASQGAIFYLKIKISDIDLIKKYQKEGYKIIVSSLVSDSLPLQELKVTKPYIIVFGNEARGVNKELLSIADYKVIIPIKTIDSLNVSVAGGIILNYLSDRGE